MEVQTVDEERETDLLSVPEAAEIAGRGNKTIRRWIYDGHLKAQKGGGLYGRYRIKRGDLAEALKFTPTAWMKKQLVEKKALAASKQ